MVWTPLGRAGPPGGPLQAFEALRDRRGVPWLDDLARDAGHGLRSLRRTPLFTAVALLTLALGIGVNTAIFSPRERRQGISSPRSGNAPAAVAAMACEARS